MAPGIIWPQRLGCRRMVRTRELTAQVERDEVCNNLRVEVVFGTTGGGEWVEKMSGDFEGGA